MPEANNMKDKHGFTKIRNQLVAMIVVSFIAVASAGYSTFVFFTIPSHTLSTLPTLVIVAFVLTLFVVISGLHLLQKLFHRLQDREAQVRAIVDHAAEGIIVVDQTGKINTFNRASEQLFGYKFSEIKGEHLSNLLPTIIMPGVMGTREIEGVHYCGQTLILSLRMTEMNISGNTMYTYFSGGC